MTTIQTTPPAKSWVKPMIIGATILGCASVVAISEIKLAMMTDVERAAVAAEKAKRHAEWEVQYEKERPIREAQEKSGAAWKRASNAVYWASWAAWFDKVSTPAPPTTYRLVPQPDGSFLMSEIEPVAPLPEGITEDMVKKMMANNPDLTREKAITLLLYRIEMQKAGEL